MSRRDLLIDTHGAAVVEPVWQLLAAAYRRFGPLPTLLERDFNLPPLSELFHEIDRIAAIQRRAFFEAEAGALAPATGCAIGVR